MVTSTPLVTTRVAKDAGRRRQDPPAEDQLDLFGPAQIQVVGDQRLEEQPAVARGVEHQGAGDFDLPHRQLPPVTQGPVRGGQRQRQPAHPTVEECMDLGRPELVADGLQPGRVVTAGEAVGQPGPADAGVAGLAFGPLVAVQPHLHRIREVGADLDERRPEMLVPDIKVITGDPPVGPVPAEMRRAPPLRASVVVQVATRWNSCAHPIPATPDRPVLSCRARYGFITSILR